jgi:tetratricopeptide (TPR) repeat protein
MTTRNKGQRAALLDEDSRAKAQRKYRGARDLYEEASRHAPSDPVVHQRLGEVTARLADIPGAIDALRLAASLYELGRHDARALACLRMIHDLDPGNPAARLARACIPERGRLGSAVSTLAAFSVRAKV